MRPPKPKSTKKSRRKPTKKRASFFASDIGSAMAIGAAGQLGSRLLGSILDSAPTVISIEIESAEVNEAISLKTRGLRLTIKPKPEPTKETK